MSKQFKNTLTAVLFGFALFQFTLIMVEGLVKQIEIEDAEIEKFRHNRG